MAEGSLAVGVTIEVVMMFCAMALDAQRHTAGFLFFPAETCFSDILWQVTLTTLREVLNWDERGGCNGDLGQAHLHRGEARRETQLIRKSYLKWCWGGKCFWLWASGGKNSCSSWVVRVQLVQPRWCSTSWCSRCSWPSARPKAIAGGFPGHRGDTEAGTEEEEEGEEEKWHECTTGLPRSKKPGNNYFSFVLPLYQSYQSAAHNASLSLTISAVSSAVEIVRKQRNALELYHFITFHHLH